MTRANATEIGQAIGPLQPVEFHVSDGVPSFCLIIMRQEERLDRQSLSLCRKLLSKKIKQVTTRGYQSDRGFSRATPISLSELLPCPTRKNASGTPPITKNFLALPLRISTLFIKMLVRSFLTFCRKQGFRLPLRSRGWTMEEFAAGVIKADGDIDLARSALEDLSIHQSRSWYFTEAVDLINLLGRAAHTGKKKDSIP
ncbi:hypothetical protein U1Q18_043943 [Sarracenia purpurea var. burkii]